MSYGRNFGIRSFQNLVRNGRHKTPAGSAWLLGTAAVVDNSDPDFLARPAAAAAPTPLSGIVIYEHIQKQNVDPTLTTTSDDPFNKAPANKYAQVISGPGAKIWLRNTDEKTLYDGRTQDAVTMVALGATPAVGEYLTPAADGTWEEGSATNGWLIIESANLDTGLFECRFTF